MVSQAQVLNKVLSTGDYSLISNNGLNADYFFNYKTEFNFIKNHYEQFHKVPDLTTFQSTFPEFPITNVTEPDSYLLDTLFDDYNAGYLAMRFNAIKKYLENGQSKEAVRYFKESVENLHNGATSTCIDLISDHSRYDSFIERSTGGINKYLSTGLPELDNALGGGIDPTEENMVIAARTGIGKTWLLCILAAAFSQQHKTVGIYSGEMSSDKIGYRIDTLLGKINNKSITRGDPDPRAQLAYKTYLDNLSSADYGPIKVITPKDINGPATVDALQSFVEREHIEVLLIDQYSLLEDTSKTTIMHERVANISKAIKNLQVLKRMPIISVSQMNRTKNEDGEQDTTQIGLSDRIGQDATIILMLDRVVNKDSGESQLVINPVKLRDGGDNKKLTYQADFNTGVFNFVDVVSDKDKAKAMKDSYNE